MSSAQGLLGCLLSLAGPHGPTGVASCVKRGPSPPRAERVAERGPTPYVTQIWSSNNPNWGLICTFPVRSDTTNVEIGFATDTSAAPSTRSCSISDHARFAEFTPNEPGRGDLVLYDMAPDTTLPTPTGVNTARHESNPTNSGDYLLFDRDRFAPRNEVESIVLHNTMTDTETILVESEPKLLLSGQVNGNWAVYVVCGPRGCNVFRYDITNDETAKVPNPGGKYQYASSVSDGGVVYLRPLRAGVLPEREIHDLGRSHAAHVVPAPS